jgi:hypothetical protein
MSVGPLEDTGTQVEIQFVRVHDQHQIVPFTKGTKFSMVSSDNNETHLFQL